jgi:hypothetical protein
MDSAAPVLGSMIFDFATPVMAALAPDNGAPFLSVDMEQTTFDLATVQVSGKPFSLQAAQIVVADAGANHVDTAAETLACRADRRARRPGT